MTKNLPADDGDLVVVDGSNIATEGRSAPSLAQLNEAVLSYRDEHPDVRITVVVDATFGHRIDRSEVGEFDAAVAHNELVAPPAGAVGRGDAFVLGIANKSGATVLSNDSFQEFHGTYPWLFDEGRLVGGKPVPYVGWVFVNRLPVKGPVSRKARAAGDKTPARRSASKLASLPMPVPTSPPPGPPPGPPSAPAPGPAPKAGRAAGRTRRGQRAAATVDASADATAAAAAVVAAAAAAAAKAASARGGPVNELLPFLDFVEHHPIGSSVSGVVESYSSHGAYVTVGEVRGYVPLRLMGVPPPRSAREVMKQGEAITLVVDSFAPARRSIDLALPGVGSAAAVVEPVHKGGRTRKKAAEPVAKKTPVKRAPDTTTPATAPDTTRSAATAPVAPEMAVEIAVEAPPVEAPTTDTRATPPPAKAPPAKKAAAKKSPGDKATATKKAVAKKAAAPAKAAPAKKAAAKKAAAKKAPAKAAATKTVATRTPAPAPSKRARAKKSAQPAP